MRYGQFGGGAVEEWFSVEFVLQPAAVAPTAMHVSEVARRISRSVPAVLKARRAGRIPPAPMPASAPRGCHPQAFVLATEEDLERWRLPSLHEALSSRPDLPSVERDWISVSDCAVRLGVTYDKAAKLIRRCRPPRLQWGGNGPFRGVIRYWIPEHGGAK